jgi:hypothetical protein
MDSGDAERQARDMDITREERRYLARNSLVERLGVDPRLAEYLLELRERIRGYPFDAAKRRRLR